MTEIGNVLVLTLPVGACDVNFLTPLQEYLLRGLEAHCLVLPRDATLEVRQLPTLGGVKVETSGEKPKHAGGRPKKTPAVVPNPGTQANAVWPAPAVLREGTVKPKPAPRKPVRAKLPYEDEILPSYRQAANRREQIRILADLNACSEERIREFLEDAGEVLPETSKAGAHG